MLHAGNVAEIIKNTAVSTIPQDNVEWIEVKHYKKYLYMVPHQKILVDNKMMTSNIMLKVVGYEKKVDLLHIFLILMTHIKYAFDSERKKFGFDIDNVRLSVPISA